MGHTSAHRSRANISVHAAMATWVTLAPHCGSIPTPTFNYLADQSHLADCQNQSIKQVRPAVHDALIEALKSGTHSMKMRSLIVIQLSARAYASRARGSRVKRRSLRPHAEKSNPASPARDKSPRNRRIINAKTPKSTAVKRALPQIGKPST